MTPKVILFNGPARSGKDTCEKFLIEKHPDIFFAQKFSEPLKSAVHKLLGLDLAHFNSYDECKDFSHEDFFGHIPRQDYIAMAERFAKVMYGPEHFGNVFMRLYNLRMNACVSYTQNASMRDNVCVVSDCGFEPECAPLIRTFGPENVWLFRLYRKGMNYSNDSRGYIGNIVPNVFEIVNIEGQPERMLQQLEWLLTINKVFTNFYAKQTKRIPV